MASWSSSERKLSQPWANDISILSCRAVFACGVNLGSKGGRGCLVRERTGGDISAVGRDLVLTRKRGLIIPTYPPRKATPKAIPAGGNALEIITFRLAGHIQTQEHLSRRLSLAGRPKEYFSREEFEPRFTAFTTTQLPKGAGRVVLPYLPPPMGEREGSCARYPRCFSPGCSGKAPAAYDFGGAAGKDAVARL